MKIDSQKDLAKLIALCRKTGVQSIRVDNIEFHLGEEPITNSKKISNKAKSSISLPKTETPSTGPDVIDSDEMTPDQLLMWSVTGTPDSSAADQN